MEESAPAGVHLVGSVPLGSAEEVFRSVAEALGDRLRRLPDGETGARSDWIVWQYPLFSSRPQFEMGPPGESSYRALPQLRLRSGVDASGLAFEELGYASAAIASYDTFARLKREGAIPAGCRFLVSLPTPLAPVSAFVALEDQAELEPVYEAQMQAEVERILGGDPGRPARDPVGRPLRVRDAGGRDRGLVRRRAGRRGRAAAAAGEPGARGRRARLPPLLRRRRDGHFAEPEDARKLVEVANALAATGRPLNWIHMPVPPEREDDRYFAPLGELRLPRETELYLGLIHAGDDGAPRRIAAARAHVDELRHRHRVRLGPRRRGRRRRACWSCTASSARRCPTAADAARRGRVRVAGRLRPRARGGLDRPRVDEAGIAYDHVDAHGWYRNLDLTVEDLTRSLRDGDLLLDYSGGTGMLLDRLRLRIFDRRIGVVIVDASAKFLRVALEKYRGDPLVALRLLRYLREERRLQTLDEVLDVEVDALACTNAIHLYPDLGDTLGRWMRALRPGGGVFINSGNIRNPRAKPAEWILDETVWVINDLAEGLVRSDPHTCTTARRSTTPSG